MTHDCGHTVSTFLQLLPTGSHKLLFCLSLCLADLSGHVNVDILLRICACRIPDVVHSRHIRRGVGRELVNFLRMSVTAVRFESISCSLWACDCTPFARLPARRACSTVLQRALRLPALRWHRRLRRRSLREPGAGRRLQTPCCSIACRCLYELRVASVQQTVCCSR